jgi:uncharacterized damage-inducible protein DinB
MKPTAGNASTSPAEFIDSSRTLLGRDYMPKLRRIVDMLSEDDIWWRPNEASNSVGNMLLHMCGNLGQWIVSGAGGAPDTRDRQSEFFASGPIPKADLMEKVERMVGQVDLVLADLGEELLLDRLTVQNFEVSRLHAIYHSIEHFSYHLGQIAYVAKLRHGKDLGIF